MDANIYRDTFSSIVDMGLLTGGFASLILLFNSLREAAFTSPWQDDGLTIQRHAGPPNVSEEIETALQPSTRARPIVSLDDVIKMTQIFESIETQDDEVTEVDMIVWTTTTSSPEAVE